MCEEFLPSYFDSNFSNKEGKSVDTDDEKQAIVVNSIKNLETFHQQVLMLQQLVQPNFADVAPKYNQVCSDLHCILSQVYPGCNVHPFGSTITGLGFKESDVDIYVSNVRLYKSNDKGFFYRTKAALQKSNLFKNVVAIIHAKIPIIRCQHRRTDISCDVNFTNMLGVYNSQLINYFLNLDEKLKPLMILIKYWAKVFKITGQSHLFKNYALTMMFIFFLQHSPYKLPSVEMLQRNPDYHKFEGDWNAGFCPLVQFDLSALKAATSLEIFKEFLLFYANFDYKTYILCPFLGKPIKKDDFDHEVPVIFECYRNNRRLEPLQTNKPICLQDPIEHTRNITSVSENVLDDFIDCCNITIKNIISNNGEESLLYNLFTYKYIKLDKVPKFTARFTVGMGNNLKFLEKKVPENTNNRIDELRKLWFQTVRTVTTYILQNIFKFNIEEKDIKLDESLQDNNDSENMKPTVDSMSYECIGYYCLWNSRPRAKISQNKLKHSVLDREKEVSEELIKTMSPSDIPILQFQLIVEMKLNPNSAKFSLQNFRSYKKTFKTFSLYFISKFPGWFHEYMNDLNNSVDMGNS